MSDNYRGISVQCDSLDDMFVKHEQVDEIIMEEGGEPDGGGSMCDGKWVRDIYFDATDEQFERIMKRVKAKFKIVS